MRRRWERKKHYLFDEKHSLWRHESEVKRDEARLAQTDHELMEARLYWVKCQASWRGWRSYYMLSERYFANPGDPVLKGFFERAIDRLCVTRLWDLPSYKLWPGVGHNWKAWNAEHFGLAIAYGLEYSDRL